MNKKIFALFLFVSITQALHQHEANNNNCDPAKNQYYDQVDKICRRCPPGSPRYNTQYKMCECCPNNMIWDENYLKCICPKDKPVHNDKRHICKACPKGLEFDAQQNQCFHCPEGFIRGPSKTCVPMYA